VDAAEQGMGCQLRSELTTLAAKTVTMANASCAGSRHRQRRYSNQT